VLETGLSGTTRYELNLLAGAKVSGCLIRGVLLDPTHSVSGTNNVLDAPPPLFDKNYVPAAAPYQQAGYRPPAITPPPK
jgi:DNA-binding helix-hairpin-helix protein with protein kinase domain